MRPFLLTLLLFVAVTFASALEPEEEWRIHVEMHVVVMPEKEAFALLPEMRDEAKMPTAWEKVQKLMDAGTAKILAVPGGVSADNEQIVAREGEDVKYPSEFEAPYILETKEGAKKAQIPATAGKGEAKQPPPVGFAPTLFETRFTGIKLEADVSTNDPGTLLELTVEASHTRLLSWEEFETARLSNGEKVSVKQPKFGEMFQKCHLVLKSGERTLLGIHRVPGKPGEMELFLLRAWTTRVKADAK